MNRGDIALGLVHQQIHVTFDAMQQFPIHANVIALEISLGAEFGDDLSIHRNRTAGDKLLRRAAGRDPSSSNDFLQAFRGHVKKRLSDRTILAPVGAGALTRPAERSSATLWRAERARPDEAGRSYI